MSSVASASGSSKRSKGWSAEMICRILSSMRERSSSEKVAPSGSSKS